MTIVDYNINNWCSVCRIKHPKDITRCIECGMMIRTSGRRNPQIKR